MKIPNILDADLKNKKIIARFDFNVPLKDSVIQDTTRIDLALETIQYILNQNPNKLILISHLGRPNGTFSKELSLEPIASYLAEKLDQEITLTESCLDRGIKTLTELSATKIILLENLRFHKEETKNDHEFAKHLASYADVYINDAFGCVHRKHASTYEITQFFKGNAFAGLLLKKEIDYLSKIINSQRKSFTTILGGAKIHDKIKTIQSLLVKAENLLIGGAMSYPFLKALNIPIGKSLCSDTDVALAKKILNSPYSKKIHLPIDHIISNRSMNSATHCDNQNIPNESLGLDIGPKTIEKYKKILQNSKFILWNGPMGYFEKKEFSTGTVKIAKIISELNVTSVVGGGDSIRAIKESNLSKNFSHLSTGGGAFLEFIEKENLPGIQALQKARIKPTQ